MARVEGGQDYCARHDMDVPIDSLCSACESKYETPFPLGTWVGPPGNRVWTIPDPDETPLEDATTDEIERAVDNIGPHERLRSRNCVCGFVPNPHCPVDHMGKRK